MVKSKALPDSARPCKQPRLAILSLSPSPSQTWPYQGWSHISSISRRRRSSWGYPLDPAKAGPRHSFASLLFHPPKLPPSTVQGAWTPEWGQGPPDLESSLGCTSFHKSLHLWFPLPGRLFTYASTGLTPSPSGICPSTTFFIRPSLAALFKIAIAQPYHPPSSFLFHFPP